MQKVTENGEESIVLNVLDWYTDMRALDDGVYTCFEKTVKDGSETGKKEHNTVVIKVIDKNEMIEDEFEGKCIIIVQNKGKLYLFNTGEYTVIPAVLSFWQKTCDYRGITINPSFSWPLAFSLPAGEIAGVFPCPFFLMTFSPVRTSLLLPLKDNQDSPGTLSLY